MKKSLVIGASGYVGKAIADKLKMINHPIITHCNSNGNRDSIKFDFFWDDISRKMPLDDIETVIFTAMVEGRTNSDLKNAMVRFAKTFAGSRIVYLSSDAVFSGEKGHYSEEDNPDSKSIYGRNLILCEELIRKYCPNHCVIRPSYLYGFSGGKLDRRLSATKEHLLAGRKVNFFCDMYKSPLGVQQFAEAALSLAQSGYIGTIHVAGERENIFDFHLKAMRALGVTTENLRSINMQENCNLPKDTSLDISKWKKLASEVPLSIKNTLT